MIPVRCVAVLAAWITIYCVITMNVRVKQSIKLTLKIRFGDVDEKLWALLVSLYYIFFPFLCLLFAPVKKIFETFISGTLDSMVLLTGVTGFFASLTISCIVLDWGVAVKNIDYSDMNNVKWMKQVRKISPLFAVGAALTEEFFLRFLVPAVIWLRSGDDELFLILLAATSVLFTLLQIAYASSPIQRFVKLVAGLSISLTSVLLIWATGNIIPSLITHGGYVFFFFTGRSEEETPRATLNERI